METDDQKGDEAKRLATFGMGRDSKGMETFINSRADLHCVSCKRVILVGEFRYPVWITGTGNRCSECYYSRHYLITGQIEKIAKEYPLIPHTRSSRLFSSVRRMKAENEHNIPIHLRNAFVYSTETMTAKQVWEKFYSDSCSELKTDYPELHGKLFPEGIASLGYNQANMQINPPTEVKAVQFVGSPFQGKQAEQIREQAKSNSNAKNSKLSKMTALVRQIGIWAFWIVVAYLAWTLLVAQSVECGAVGYGQRSIDGGVCI